VTTVTGRSGSNVGQSETTSGGPAVQPGPPQPRKPRKSTTTVTVELTTAELDGLAWGAIHVGISDRERAAESAIRRLRAVVRPMAPQRRP
jgi:hypothetical protein